METGSDFFTFDFTTCAIMLPMVTIPRMVLQENMSFLKQVKYNANILKILLFFDLMFQKYLIFDVNCSMHQIYIEDSQTSLQN